MSPTQTDAGPDPDAYRVMHDTPDQVYCYEHAPLQFPLSRVRRGWRGGVPSHAWWPLNEPVFSWLVVLAHGPHAIHGELSHGPGFGMGAVSAWRPGDGRPPSKTARECGRHLSPRPAHSVSSDELRTTARLALCLSSATRSESRCLCMRMDCCGYQTVFPKDGLCEIGAETVFWETARAPTNG
jgi:hypothetical protein